MRELMTRTRSKYGAWGHLEYTRQPPELAPKYRAVQVRRARFPCNRARAREHGSAVDMSPAAEAEARP